MQKDSNNYLIFSRLLSLLILVSLAIFHNPFLISQVQAQAQNGYIIVHALNPEGIEINSIDDVVRSYLNVQIFDDTRLRGTGAHNSDTCNKLIALTPGPHTINVTFNGMTITKEINIIDGETKELNFIFDRTEMDISFNSAVSSGVSGSFSLDLRCPEYPCEFSESDWRYRDANGNSDGWSAIGAEIGSNEWCEGAYDISSSYSISPSSYSANANVSVAADGVDGRGHDYSINPCGTKAQAVIQSPFSVDAPVQTSFNYWIAQSIVSGDYPQIRLTNQPSEENYKYHNILPVSVSTGKPGEGYHVSPFWAKSTHYRSISPGGGVSLSCVPPYAGYVNGPYSYNESISRSGTLTLKVSSVPYDLLDTGITCGAVVPNPNPEPEDFDDDGIPDDGDNSGTPGDNPCTGGNTVDCDDNCPRDINSNQADIDVDGTGDICEPSTDLSISEVNLVQAVFDPDIENDERLDLVLDRQTALIVTVLANDLDTETVVIKAWLGDQEISSESVVLSTTGAEGEKIPIFFTPVEPYNHDLVVEIDPDNNIEEMDDKINNRKMKKVAVRATKDLVVPYVLFSSCEGPEPCYSPLDPGKVIKHITNSNTFLQATYPVPDYGIISGIAGEIKGHQKDPKKKPEEAIIKDLIRVFNTAFIQSAGNAKRAVGVVPDDYFVYHSYGNGCPKGVAKKELWGVLTREGYWSAAAHELGHTFYLDNEYDNVDLKTCTAGKEGNPTDGYWVAKRQQVSDAFGFMGTIPKEGELFPGGSDQPPNRWVTKDNWYKLMRELDSQRPDPELLLLSGIIHIDGSVELQPWFMLPEGTPVFHEEGSHTIRMRDQAGTTLLTVPLDLSFTLYIDPFGVIDTDTTGFVAAVPYPPETATVSIEKPTGLPIFMIDPSSKTLRDAIQAIPDRCFIKNSSQRRNALKNKIKAMQHMLEDGDNYAAINKLENDILKHLESWLINGCEKGTPLEMTKEDLLELVDDTIQRLMVR